MERSKSLMAQWRDANAAASQAEQALFEASLLYLRGHGPKPAEDDVKAVKQLRAHAVALFKTALAQFESSARNVATRPGIQPDQPSQH